MHISGYVGSLQHIHPAPSTFNKKQQLAVLVVSLWNRAVSVGLYLAWSASSKSLMHISQKTVCQLMWGARWQVYNNSGMDAAESENERLKWESFMGL